jgi:hypothetical protein
MHTVALEQPCAVALLDQRFGVLSVGCVVGGVGDAVVGGYTSGAGKLVRSATSVIPLRTGAGGAVPDATNSSTADLRVATTTSELGILKNHSNCTAAPIAKRISGLRAVPVLPHRSRTIGMVFIPP